MNKLLHVLNGDCTLAIMNKQQMAGDKVVWREVLCEGKTVPQVGSKGFWAERTDFFEAFFEAAPNQFRKWTIEEFEKLYRFRDYEEVVLWFEHDLFCQINMVALLSWFANQDRGNTRIALVCLGNHPDYEDMISLGEIHPKYYPELFNNRKTLHQKDLNEALRVWNCYCSDDPADLLKLKINGSFPYLKKALKAHLKRFPSVKNGLNIIENDILNLAAQGQKNPHKIVGQLLENYSYYGFGDLQYYSYFKRLMPLFEEKDGLQLNELGKDIQKGKKDFLKLQLAKSAYLGGARMEQYRWDETRKALLRA